MKKFKEKKRGFTLVELMVVIAIIGVLSSVVTSSFVKARASARDAKRKTDMVAIQTALEMYYMDYGTYPLPYGGEWTWAGYSTSNCNGYQGALSGPTGYIINLAPTYISKLPVDPSNNMGSCSGYLYVSGGGNYKLLNNFTAESFPSAGTKFYDPARPNQAWRLTNNPTVTDSW